EPGPGLRRCRLWPRPHQEPRRHHQHPRGGAGRDRHAVVERSVQGSHGRPTDQRPGQLPPVDPGRAQEQERLSPRRGAHRMRLIALSQNFGKGLAVTIAGVIIFVGSVYVIMAALMGRVMAYLVLAVSLFGWMIILAIIWTFGASLFGVGTP